MNLEILQTYINGNIKETKELVSSLEDANELTALITDDVEDAGFPYLKRQDFVRLVVSELIKRRS